MANSGNKQATVAYKIRSTDGAPLDINGEPTSETGRKQAIALLSGSPNPDPTLYEVEFYFTANTFLDGNPTVIFSPVDCPIGTIAVTPQDLLFEPSTLTQVFTLISSDAWELTATDAAIAGLFTLDINAGSAGVYDIIISVNTPSTVAQGYITFTNIISGATAKLHVANLLVKPWILETGVWDGFGIWTTNGIWNTI